MSVERTLTPIKWCLGLMMSPWSSLCELKNCPLTPIKWCLGLSSCGLEAASASATTPLLCRCLLPSLLAGWDNCVSVSRLGLTYLSLVLKFVLCVHVPFLAGSPAHAGLLSVLCVCFVFVFVSLCGGSSCRTHRSACARGIVMLVVSQLCSYPVASASCKWAVAAIDIICVRLHVLAHLLCSPL